MPAKRKPIHFVFRSHTEGEKYLPLKYTRGIKTHVFEHATGSLAGMDSATLPSYSEAEPTRIRRSLKRFFEELTKRKVRAFAGESYKTEEEVMRLFKLEEYFPALLEAIRKPSLVNIKKYYSMFAQCDQFRHELTIALQ